MVREQGTGIERACRDVCSATQAASSWFHSLLSKAVCHPVRLLPVASGSSGLRHAPLRRGAGGLRRLGRTTAGR